MNQDKSLSLTGRVLLRGVMEDDLPIFYEQQLDLDAIRMAGFPSRDLGTFMLHWKSIMKNPSNVLQAILLDGQVAGNIVSWKEGSEREVGYWLGKEYWGKGIATAALREFLKLIKMRPLHAYVVKPNLASRRVLEKCGFVVVGEEGGEVVLRNDGQI